MTMWMNTTCRNPNRLIEAESAIIAEWVLTKQSQLAIDMLARPRVTDRMLRSISRSERSSQGMKRKFASWDEKLSFNPTFSISTRTEITKPISTKQTQFLRQAMAGPSFTGLESPKITAQIQSPRCCQKQSQSNNPFTRPNVPHCDWIF